jgi:ABC-type transport system involved in cytochrome c biogenesis permease subunit
MTESLPLILSPDMDPIVAVLRNNFWLTIHVLTISISYAAFTISMLIGNSHLVMTILGRQTQQRAKDLAHLAYRAVQLGVFLLTAGIILGGWWADYSWGRFWGWDPKETWALIADLGYLSILHARYVGWLGPAGVLAAAPAAYLLVIMAWYGVNFILASGLHSYGFSSGGATIVAVFVGVQLLLLAAGAGMDLLRGALKERKV